MRRVNWIVRSRTRKNWLSLWQSWWWRGRDLRRRRLRRSVNFCQQFFNNDNKLSSVVRCLEQAGTSTMSSVQERQSSKVSKLIWVLSTGNIWSPEGKEMKVSSSIYLVVFCTFCHYPRHDLEHWSIDRLLSWVLKRRKKTSTTHAARKEIPATWVSGAFIKYPLSLGVTLSLWLAFVFVYRSVLGINNDPIGLSFVIWRAQYWISKCDT